MLSPTTTIPNPDPVPMAIPVAIEKVDGTAVPLHASHASATPKAIAPDLHLRVGIHLEAGWQWEERDKLTMGASMGLTMGLTMV